MKIMSVIAVLVATAAVTALGQDGVVQDVKHGAKKTGETIKDGLETAGEKTKETAKTVGKKTKETAETVGAKTKETAQTVGEKAKERARPSRQRQGKLSKARVRKRLTPAEKPTADPQERPLRR